MHALYMTVIWMCRPRYPEVNFGPDGKGPDLVGWGKWRLEVAGHLWGSEEGWGF